MAGKSIGAGGKIALVSLVRMAPCLMVQGTASGVGKSVLVTALCRLFAQAGYRVAPFKSQNMSLNAAVTPDGGEIGRAQAAQAEAAGIEPTVDMNPILLKPEADDRSQLIVRGVPRGSLGFAEYALLRAELVGVLRASLERLRATADVVVIEGAGSPAEINLQATELVNMSVARMADAPVLLVGDIDRGGVFGALVGTLALLEPADRVRVAGFVINKFRGDLTVLAPGLELLRARTGVPVLGVVPWLDGPLAPAEDSLGLDAPATPAAPAALDVAVVRLARIANFDDFEPLAREPGVRVRFVGDPRELEGADLLVLPGTKSTAADLGVLRERGLADAVARRAGAEEPVIGICGGYQMLGEALLDPRRVESAEPAVAGLGLLPVVTTFASVKTTARVRARALAPVGPFAAARGAELEAYEIHMGQTEVRDVARPFAITARSAAPADDLDGALDPRGAVLGTYLHGLFANDALRRALLGHLAARKGARPDPRWGRPAPAAWDRLADAVRAAVDVRAIGRLVGLRVVA